MPDHFYRFRPTSALLDGYHELENQEIYFPTLNELNDPLEGFKDVVWRGDRIVWRNLFRHYLLCLTRTVSLVAFLGKEFTPKNAGNLVYETDIDLPVAPIREIYGRACNAFFNHEAADPLLNNLSETRKAVRRDELTYYLRLIHFSILTTVVEFFEDNGLKLMKSTSGMAELSAEVMATVPEILRLHSLADDDAKVLFFITENITQQLALIHELNNPVPEDRRSWLFIAHDFPTYYVTALERLLYPEWHAACFVTDPTNAAMWGHYGDGHQGMCLKFRGKPNNTGGAGLDLYKATSWGGNNHVGYSYVAHPFEPIRYTSEFPEIDFFESLGRLPKPKLKNFWYAGQNGELSDVATTLFSDEAKWREEYWRKFFSIYRTKLPQWSYENEHRIILSSSLENLESKEVRKLKYRFEDLAGIVFGLKTSTESKIAAMRIIERKCVESRRTDFEFWQAHYSHRTRQIELARLGLIKIDPGVVAATT
ncbi:MAG TPA: DUF2971 domain-containing protein [Acidocella sp.]|jgi:hypothetical protein|uniref:DUF2971 domain-containing protein n=1 Tax=Acidocella sp. TaxID=50710 RepID=UPI002CC43452|nr:DUF2971 domain-containing protein [Acidocella sp.]HVE22956.1 DUF2971 domain-containing protein [Acidocella sp.]